MASDLESKYQSPQDEVLPEFNLSCELKDHSKAVRDIAIYDSNLLVTGELEGRIHVWERTAGNAFRDKIVFSRRIHEDLMFCIQPLRTLAHAQYAEQTFASGGKDKRVRVWTAAGQFYPDMTGFPEPVNSISQMNNPLADLIVGCWDGCAYLFKKGKLVRNIPGHQYATEVLGLLDGGFVTGSVGREINIWDAEFNLVRKINNAHQHAIKKILLHPLGFVTCGNDGFIKVWSLGGELLSSIQAHFADPGGDYDSFILGLAVFPDGAIASAGEDRRLRVWNPDGSLLQEVAHPGCVYCVKILPNGDLVTGCADKVARIFTRIASRRASDEDLANFQNLMALVGQAKLQDIDQDALPDVSALKRTGKRHGESIVVRVPGRGAIAYSWNQEEQQWIEVGEAFAQAAAPASNVAVPGRNDMGKKMLDGVEYDNVIDIHIDASGTELKLGFNRDDEEDEVARNFVAKYGLPNDYTQQIMDYIRPMIDKDAQLARRRAKNHRPEDDFKQLPAWKSAYHMFREMEPALLERKVLEFNDQLAQTEHAMTPSERTTFDKLLINIRDTGNYHVAPFPDAQLSLIHKLLKWPAAKVLPVLDSVRMLMCHHEACQKLGRDAAVREALLEYSRNGNDMHKSFVLRVLTNWVARRPKTDQERDGRGPDADTAAFLCECLTELAAAASSENKTLYTSYVMFVFNAIVWLGRFKQPESDLYMVIASGLFEFLGKEHTEMANFYALLTLGSIAFASESAKQMIFDVYGDQLGDVFACANRMTAAASKELAQDLAALLRR